MSALAVCGMEPLMWVLDRSKIWRLVSEARSSGGMEAVREVLEAASSVSAVRAE